MHANEARGIKLFFRPFHRPPAKVHPPAGVKLEIIVGGIDPVDIGNIHEVVCSAAPDHIARTKSA